MLVWVEYNFAKALHESKVAMKIIITIFLVVNLLPQLFCIPAVTQEEDVILVIESKQQELDTQKMLPVLTTQELAEIVGSHKLEQEVINLMHERMSINLATGKTREDTVAELKAFINEFMGVGKNFVDTSLLLGITTVVLVSGVCLWCLVQHLCSKPSQPEHINTPITTNSTLNVQQPGVVTSNSPNSVVEKDSNKDQSDDDLNLLNEDGKKLRTYDSNGNKPFVDTRENE